MRVPDLGSMKITITSHVHCVQFCSFLGLRCWYVVLFGETYALPCFVFGNGCSRIPGVFRGGGVALCMCQRVLVLCLRLCGTPPKTEVRSPPPPPRHNNNNITPTATAQHDNREQPPKCVRGVRHCTLRSTPGGPGIWATVKRSLGPRLKMSDTRCGWQARMCTHNVVRRHELPQDTSGTPARLPTSLIRTRNQLLFPLRLRAFPALAAAWH